MKEKGPLIDFMKEKDMDIRDNMWRQKRLLEI
jgi:hypothetical protein